jgi:hypothetical protein
MKASMALVATNTRVEELPIEDFSAEDAIESGPHGSRAQLLSASTRLAVGLGLKGVLPCAGWAGLTDSPRRKFLSVAGPPFPQSRGIGRHIDSNAVLHTSATLVVELMMREVQRVNFRPQNVSGVLATACSKLQLFSHCATLAPALEERRR